MFLAFLFWKFFCDSEKVKIFKATFPMELFSVPISCSLSTLPTSPHCPLLRNLQSHSVILVTGKPAVTVRWV